MFDYKNILLALSLGVFMSASAQESQFEDAQDEQVQPQNQLSIAQILALLQDEQFKQENPEAHFRLLAQAQALVNRYSDLEPEATEFGE